MAISTPNEPFPPLPPLSTTGIRPHAAHIASIPIGTSATTHRDRIVPRSRPTSRCAMLAAVRISVAGAAMPCPFSVTSISKAAHVRRNGISGLVVQEMCVITRRLELRVSCKSYLFRHGVEDLGENLLTRCWLGVNKNSDSKGKLSVREVLGSFASVERWSSVFTDEQSQFASICNCYSVLVCLHLLHNRK